MESKLGFFISIKKILLQNLNAVKIVLVLMYLAGFLGMQNNITKPYFLNLTSFNLIVSCSLLLFFHETWNRKFIINIILVALFGFIIEVIGVKTKVVFGDYQYGSTLGVQAYSVPIAIGINWLMLTYLMVHFTQNIFKPYTQSKIILSVITAILMVSLDCLIERVAVKYDFWSWFNNEIPLQNFIAWFFFSFLFSLIFFKDNTLIKNKIANLLLLLQVLFFLFHNIFLK